MMIAPFIQGFGAGGGLIVAIGAQNAFVLSQGVRGNHHVIIALICILCDAIFITAGVAGIGGTVSADPALAQWVTWGGAGFLFVYGCGSLRSAVRGGSLETNDRTVLSLNAAVMTTLAVTLLNPHFYLDTVVLLGSISSRFDGENRLLFWAGSVSASTLWFICLSLGGQMLAPVFRKPISWRILDTLVWATMWTIAASLLMPGMLD
ncbi:LysE/ArgO family amino acid transporter [Desulfopila aestuarii]|uniref:L-lysine exporter family protein LysE/ArgO n=1 Tax=Desulfopila aestuarii DSM 18488 TaxID=1121416 RepID=A0A1M7Y3H2_9BACT|nr:LysE/ArgO family amino acid transporter [Desulfopila aestuarii]SHO46679.1 L-lysine exporter family protein LysE/ArgO [Desulfopila aestuarii DSM 18488]